MSKETETKQGEVDSLLKEMFSIRISGLTWFLDSANLLESVPDTVTNDILNAYHHAYRRFLFYVLHESKDAIPLTDFPSARIVLTQNPDIFRTLYPAPHRFDQLPRWVRAYVNFNKSCFVLKISLGEEMHVNVDNYAHEFTHTIIPHVLGLPPSYLSKFWPIWVHEAIPVGANQQQSREWVSREIRVMTTFPTTTSIETNGIFPLDERQPHLNPIYQYCVLITEAVGEEIARNLYPDLTIPPLAAVCDLTQQAFRQGKTTSTFRDEVARLGTNIDQIEKQLQRSLRV